ncbi:MAG: exosortase-associated EpsI family protein [Verrucomicrobiota bacterium]
MKRGKWVVFVVALGMIAATAGWLTKIRGMHVLGRPGVRVGPVAIYDEHTNLVATQGVVLPTNVMGLPSRPLPISTAELAGLPGDTTFGRMGYGSAADGFQVQLTTVLMGTDHTSIHQPQYCLYAQGWNITNAERIVLRMDRPFAYDIPAVKLTATRQFLGKDGQTRVRSCLYVYWFVSGDKITDDEGTRLWSIASGLLKKGEIERWAYISYFSTCLPGGESAMLDRLKKFIGASAPEFQTVTGRQIEHLAPAARN